MISEKYRLEIRWGEVSYLKDGTVIFKNCYFTGPVLKEALKLNDKDHMSLDFGTQYITFVGNYFIADFNWEGVVYKEDVNRIYFDKAKLTTRYPDNIPTLSNRDYLVLDTSAHDTSKIVVDVERVLEKKKRFQQIRTINAPLSYKTYLLKEDGSLYNFKGQ